MRDKNILGKLPKVEAAWLEANYPNMPSALLAKRYGVKLQSLYQYAWRHGWRKSGEYRKRMNHDRVMASVATRKARGDKFCHERVIEANKKLKGKTLEEIYGEEKAQAIRANMRKARHKMAVMERNRRLCGLAPLTRMGYSGLPKSTLHLAWRIRKRGYRTDYKTMTAYYSDETSRSEFYENGRRGRGCPFRFKPEPWYEKKLTEELLSEIETEEMEEEEICQGTMR